MQSARTNTRNSWIRLTALTGAVISAMAFTGAAFAWTPAVSISGSKGTNAKVAKGAGNAIHTIWYEGDWRVRYRSRSASGVWSAAETLSTDFSFRPDVVEDAQGRPHAIYPMNNADGRADLRESVKVNGTWQHTWLTATTNVDEDAPRSQLDSLGRIHLIYTQGTTVKYMVWNGSWSAPVALGSCQNSYYQRPDISIDPANNIHTVWGDNSHVYYRKLPYGGAWQPQLTIATTVDFCSFPKIAAASANNIVCVMIDLGLKYVASANGGSNWGALTTLVGGHWPNMEADASGNAYVAFHWLPGKTTGMMKWNGSAWTGIEIVSPGSAWQGWADIAVTANGVVHCVFDDTRTDPSLISYVNSAPDTFAPGNPTSFAAQASDSSVMLNWTNPTDPDFAGTMIRFKTSGYPTGPTDGTLVVNQAYPGAGSTGTFTHTPVTNGLTYNYRAFCYDGANNYSAGAVVSATPRKLTCQEARNAPDGSFVALTDKVVTAIFPADSALYIGDLNRSSGIRVSANVSALGLVLGDHVSVNGNIVSRVLSGYLAERMISPATVAKSIPAVVPTPLKPLVMNAKSLGGEASGLQPGVKGGVGLNSLGLLVNCTGRVVDKLATYLWVDDGCGIIDPTGTPGIIIKCPSTSIPASIGDTVSVTGILTGSIAAGETQNRRQIQIRSFATDFVKLSP